MREDRFQKLSAPDPELQNSMARITSYVHEDPSRILCSCGWAYRHPRTKVRENAAERHVNKRHGGRSIWF